VTKINIYCLFDRYENFCGVYSSLKAIHRDALKLCNKGTKPVYIRENSELKKPCVTSLRNIFKGRTNVYVEYVSDGGSIKILKTNLVE
jgi:hypothetical protein